MKIFHEVVRLPDFERDLKKLSKRFRTLEDDLDAFIQHQLKLFHKLNIDNRGIFRIPGLPFTRPKVYKAKKFASKSLKGKGVQSGIRVIYAFFEPEDRIEFVELYYKGDQENEDRGRGRLKAAALHNGPEICPALGVPHPAPQGPFGKEKTGGQPQP